MKAIVLHEHGGIAGLQLHGNWPDPTPAEHSVILAVRACALNYHDIFTVHGMPGIKVPLPIIPGIDMAGEIVAVGRDVTRFAPGDRVLVDPFDTGRGKLLGEMIDGGLAEFCEVDQSTLIPLPDDVSFAHAAALPVAYGTAHRMLIARGGIVELEKVLILGASGGVGTCCVQLAHAAGAYVVAASSSESKLAKLREIGADATINYSSDDLLTVMHRRFGKPRVWGEGGVDVVVNFTGGDTWVPSLRSLHRGGRILTCGATAGYDPKTDLRYIWTFELTVVGSNGWHRSDLAALIELVRNGQLQPVIDRIVPLRDTVAALRALEEREVVGKVIIEPGA